VSLYDRIHLSHIEKCPKKIEQDSFHDVEETETENESNMVFDNRNNEVNFHQFLKDHPLHHSHHVTLLDDMEEWVPNRGQALG
jgi:hypothetical protein